MTNTRRAGLTLLCLCIVSTGCMRLYRGGVIDSAIHPDQKLYRIWTDTVADATKPGTPDSQRVRFSFSSKLGTSVVDLKIQELIRQEMKKLGFVEEKGPAFAQVVYAYTVKPREYISSSPDVVFGGQRVYSGREYYCQLAIAIFSTVFDMMEPNAPPIWQAELHSTGGSSDMMGLAEVFVPEMFKYYGQAVHKKEFTISPILK